MHIPMQATGASGGATHTAAIAEVERQKQLIHGELKVGERSRLVG